jgi:sugar lactone lactonase YvrE
MRPRLLLPLLLLAPLTACGLDDADDRPVTCPIGGAGTLDVDARDLPAGITPIITITGPDGTRPLAGAELLPAGEYTLHAAVVTSPDPIVRTAYQPELVAESPSESGSDTGSLCLGDGQRTTVGIRYRPIATSGKLWTSGGSGGSAPMLAFASQRLTTAGAPPASVAARTRSANGYTFDRHGNLWLLGGTTVDPTLIRYGAASLEDADHAGDVEIDVRGAWDCAGRGSGLAFDAQDNLWISFACADTVVRLTPADLAATGEVSPTVAITGVASPQGLAFDARGDLWIAGGAIHRIDAGRLGASVSSSDQVITLIASGSATAARAEALAFDRHGDLWATVEGNYNFARLRRSDLDGRGARDVAPSSYLSVGVNALPRAVAFDDSDDLWFAVARGQLGMLTPAGRAESTTYARPSSQVRLIASPDVGYAGDIAFFPAAAGLPLAHALP